MSDTANKQDEQAGSAGGEVRAAGVIGVLGAGTMGAGIAQLACKSGARTLLHDPIPDALAGGVQKLSDGFSKDAARGRLSTEEAEAGIARLEAVADMAAFADCELIIEAAPERLDLKHEIYGGLSEIVGPDCVLASNTSSLLVTAIAAAATNPQRVVGMHFFNPAPVMRLLEVVAGEQSSERALAVAHATGEAMGKTVIRASDGPGFLVNRCNRPFGLEALRMLQERIADVETIDRICRMQGGFPMGPFELMDLVGVDTGFEISKSFFEQSFGEPRWRPSPIAARYVAAGRHGRKTGRGYYNYDGGAGLGKHRPEDPDQVDSAPPGKGEGVIVIAGASALAIELRAAATDVGYEVRTPHEPTGGVLPALVIDCDSRPARDVGGSTAGAATRIDRRETPAAGHGGVRLVLCRRGSLSALDPAGSAVGFHLLAPVDEAQLIELTRAQDSSPLAAQRAERFFGALGKEVAWVEDAPGLVLGRIVCQIVNECAFALGEGVGSAQDIDKGMLLGLSHPRGPLAWADQIGLDEVLALLDALCDEYREDRYRPAPILRKLVCAGRLGRATGSGFFEYDTES
jgi:3-hydroxybutyryl-CoA dehydrogenase